MAKIHVILISSVRPEPTSAGQLVLHRHLVDQPHITYEEYGFEPKKLASSTLLRRIAGKLENTLLKHFVEDFWILWKGKWIEPELPSMVQNPEATVVLTVAHGDGFMAAQRFAENKKLPLVSIYHDWWPDMAHPHRILKSRLERDFRELARASTITFCVSKGMRDALGSPPGSVILPPIPAKQPKISYPSRSKAAPFKIIYSGNLGEYGPLLGDALEESLKHPEILLQVRGSNPSWTRERLAKMESNGRWLPFAPRAELDAWLHAADAYLVPMIFEPEQRRRMETSFPSKLVEFAQFGKPLVIWGPEYCSAVRWARNGDRALCVTNDSPRLLVERLLNLSVDREGFTDFEKKAAQSVRTEFDPSAIQKRFVETIQAVLN